MTADFKNPPGDLIFRYTPQNSQFSAAIFVSYGVKILKRYVNILTKEQKVANGSYLNDSVSFPEIYMVSRDEIVSKGNRSMISM